MAMVPLGKAGPEIVTGIRVPMTSTRPAQPGGSAACHGGCLASPTQHSTVQGVCSLAMFLQHPTCVASEGSHCTAARQATHVDS
jgi:hypothetical protein